MSRSAKKSVILSERARGDGLSQKVGELNQRYEDFAESGRADEEQNKALRFRCTALIQEVDEQLQKVYRLTQDDDPTPLADFSDQKRQEIKRLNKLQDILKSLARKMEEEEDDHDPPQQAAYFKKQKRVSIEPEREEEESLLTGEDGESYFEDTGDEEEDVEEEAAFSLKETRMDSFLQTQQQEFQQVECLADFSSDQEGDLEFHAGAILYIIDDSRDDGWWLAENAHGIQGMVPSNYIRALEPGEEKVPRRGGISESTERGKELWEKLKSSMVQPNLANVLLEMGAVPSGFRSSTLGPMAKSDSNYSLSSWFTPKLSASSLSFRDLHWNYTANKLRTRPVAVNRGFSLLGAYYIPTVTPASISILSRHVRISLFNRNRVLSNIHTVRAVWIPKEPRTWKFTPKVQQGAPSMAYDADCLARTNAMSTDIMILFELSFTYEREMTGERGEMSCGWATLPLFEADGKPVANKTVELKVQGGTPYESGVELDPSLAKTAGGGKLPSLLRGRRTPKLYVKLQYLRRNVLEVCNTLPDVLVTPVSYLPFLSYARCTMADELLRDRHDEQDAAPICSPTLSLFLQTVDYPDIMDVLRDKWKEEYKVLKRSQKKQADQLKRLFGRILVENIYPILQFPDLPEVAWGEEEKEQERFETIQSVKGFSALEWFSNSDVCHKPINLSELTFNIASDHAIA